MDLKTYINELPRGGAAEFAKRLNVSASYLSQLAAGTTHRSPQRCVEIEVHSGGAVTRKDLRPDDWQSIWPELAAKASTARQQGAA